MGEVWQPSLIVPDIYPLWANHRV